MTCSAGAWARMFIEDMLYDEYAKKMAQTASSVWPT